MPNRLRISDRKWSKILDALTKARESWSKRGRPSQNDRNFIEAVLWIHRTGAPWRDLPEEFGPWTTIYNRFNAWSKKLRWKEIFASIKTDVDKKWHSIDSTVNRAHQHAAGGVGGAEKHAIGRSVGGVSTKVHLVVDAVGLPVDFCLTPGQRHDSQPALEVLRNTSPVQVLADKAYDSEEIRSGLRKRGIASHIPSRANAIRPASYDKHLYRARYQVECTFNLLKQSRRFAARYEKNALNYAAIVALACILCWTRI
jgi:transposase